MASTNPNNEQVAAGPMDDLVDVRANAHGPDGDTKPHGELQGSDGPSSHETVPKQRKPSLMNLPNEIIYKIIDEYVLTIDTHPQLFCWPENGVYCNGRPTTCPYDEGLLDEMEGGTSWFRGIEWTPLAKDVRYSVYQCSETRGRHRTPAIHIGFYGALCPVGLDDAWKSVWERLSLARAGNMFFKQAVWEAFDGALKARDLEWRTKQVLEREDGRDWLRRTLLPPLTWEEILRDKVLNKRVTAKELAENVRRSLKNRS